MKLKPKLTLIVSISSLFVLIVLVELVINWTSVNRAMQQENYAEKIDFWVDRLEIDFSYYLQYKTDDNKYNWLDSYSNLSKTLDENTAEFDSVKPQIASINSQIRGLKTLFNGLSNLETTPQQTAIKKHLTDKIIANIQTIREESRAMSQQARRNILQVLRDQMYRTVPVLLLGVILIAVSAIFLIRWLNKSIARLNRRIELMKRGEIGTFYQPKSEDEFSEIFEKINQLSRRLVETTISRDTLQNIVDERTKMLENIANSDPLTDVSTRRVLFQRGSEEFERARRHHLNLSILMIDCDFFKKINDTYGHSTGDSVLIHLCRICENEIRQVDIFARFGGEEFVIVLPETDINGAQQIAQRIQKGIKQNPLVSHGKKIAMTVSIGVAGIQSQFKNFEQLIDAADIALFKAKDSGRNTIRVNKS